MGFTVGAAIGGFVAAWLIPAFGWRSVFIFGGVVPLVIAWLMLWSLPESLQFLAVRRQRFDQLARWLKAARSDAARRREHAVRRERDEPRRRAVLAPVPRGPRGRDVLLWIVNFTNILVLYSLSGWLPTIFRTCMGYDQQHGDARSARCVQVGGTVGAFGLAWLIARARLHADARADASPSPPSASR